MFGVVVLPVSSLNLTLAIGAVTVNAVPATGSVPRVKPRVSCRVRPRFVHWLPHVVMIDVARRRHLLYPVRIFSTPVTAFMRSILLEPILSSSGSERGWHMIRIATIATTAAISAERNLLPC